MCLPLSFALLLASGAAAQAVIPNDPWFDRQISFHHPGGLATRLRDAGRSAKQEIEMAPGIHLDVQRAWGLTTGSRSVVVALLDDGFFYRHEDVIDNVWRNPGETGLDDGGLRKEINGVDDDSNGYVDDVVGWDFVFQEPDPDHYIFDGMDRSRIQPYWHSIPAMGIIGAVGDNGTGVAGINWNVSMMLLKIGAQGTPRDDPGLDRVGWAAEAIRYAADNGARVINWSGFVRPRDAEKVQALRDAIEYAGERGVMLVCGAGNDALDLDDEANRIYPQCFDLPNLLRVAQLGLDGELYTYEVGGQKRGSNYGRRRVEIAAIGENFTTGLRHGEPTYWTSNGTSNAGPVVAGVAALVLSVRPELDVAGLKKVLLDSATPLESLQDKVACGGVVNAFRAVRLAQQTPR